MEQRIVYSTDWKNTGDQQNQSLHERQKKHNTVVTIDYDQTLRLFLSQQEGIEFSPQSMLRMVNGWVRASAVRITTTKRLRITADRYAVHCELTAVAVNALSHWYFRNTAWQEEYPEASSVLNQDYTVVIAL